ncbi:unnamed protein product [Fructobacillus fructosus]|uniref:Uncharacterized protein n=1 Tax=Fructobacillus fructosus TaxID=1631 RepID=A0ABN9YMS7_9LACO|nr:unnamed protein product [Fructobacillus fructosus]CAK1252182.1 unnamed protein product [Fructobacillus fructosus]
MKNDTKKALNTSLTANVQGLNKHIQQNYNILLIEG